MSHFYIQMSYSYIEESHSYIIQLVHYFVVNTRICENRDLGKVISDLALQEYIHCFVI